VAKLDGEEKFRHHLELKNQNVLISMGSKALGDTLAWMPYIEQFRIKHGCNVYCSTWWNNILDYPDIHFIKPGDAVSDVYASYDVGCFDDQLDRNVKNWRLTTLQQVASDILGLEYEPLRTRLIYTPYKPKSNGHPPKPYICFSEFSTMRNKLWNREGAWQKIVDYLNSLGYDCVSISAEASQLTGIINHNGQSIEQTLTDISGCEFYVGLNAGPSWIAYSLNKPVLMITGVSEEWNDFPNPYRIAVNNEVCGVGCFNDPGLPINRGWEWCPRDKDYICTKSITEEMVIAVIDRLRNDKQGDILGTQEAAYDGR
jgi:autotransporter strand-loop-strand O-heptosyltransferase